MATRTASPGRSKEPGEKATKKPARASRSTRAEEPELEQPEPEQKATRAAKKSAAKKSPAEKAAKKAPAKAAKKAAKKAASSARGRRTKVERRAFQVSEDMKFPITMLGARGVGKTSMIAAMWNEFDQVSTDPSLELLADKQTEVELEARLKELKSIGSGAARPILSGEGIEASIEPRDYILDFYHTGTRVRLKIVFRDYPGAWLNQENQKFKRIVNKLADARIILVAIDAPALMDSDERNEAQNRPTDVAAALNQAFKSSSSDDPRLVLFVLMKGERWLRDKQGKQVLDRFEKHFSKALAQVHARKSSMAAVVCPIQTLGAVRFVEFNADGQAVFEKISHEEYRPVDCDQPLRYSMAFMTKALEDYAEAERQKASQALAQRSWWERIKDSSLGLFGIKSAKQKAFDEWLERSKELRESVSSFSGGCKQDELFRVIHSPELIGVKRTV